MLTFLRGIWSSAKAKQAHFQPSARKPETRSSAPLPVVVGDPTSEIVRRETLIDRSERIAAYEFSLFSNLQDRLKWRAAVSRRAFDTALLMRLALNDGASLLGQRLALVNLALESVHEPLLMNIPAKSTVLMLKLAQGEDSDWAALRARVAELHAHGFALGLHLDLNSDAQCALMEWVDYVQVDVTRFDGLALRELVASLRDKRGPGGKRLRLLALNLQSHDEYLFSHKSGFHYFHGPFLGGQRGPMATGGSINRTVVLPILNMVLEDASYTDIADSLRGQPTLTYKLLRYLNSPAMGLQKEITDLSQALALVGRAQFHRWMSLLLFDFTNPSYPQRILAERALTRARTLELLAGKGHIPATPDALFLAGLFSLMDEVLDIPMEELLARAAMPQAVRDAMVNNTGPLADALRLVVLSEAGSTLEPTHLERIQQACGIGDSVFSVATHQALTWASTALGDAE